MEASNSYLSSQPGDPKDSPEGYYLLLYKSQLEEMRNLFLYDLDFRAITRRHIDGWEGALRTIVAGIGRMQDAPQTYAVVTSCDGLQDTIWRAIQKLYVASDLIPRKEANEREKLYRSFRECAIILKEAIDKFYKI
ncbi:MAG: hypothetical protein JO011_00255 [Ktedonobacteraceae bacterium]|nr:hypothetical protein [Ktedonobacteraceae bacterium]MBV9709327.1 hypothetical protein [Ktedonobacteraceae bacterium]